MHICPQPHNLSASFTVQSANATVQEPQEQDDLSSIYTVIANTAAQSHEDNSGFTGIPFDEEYSIVDGAMVKRCRCLIHRE